MTITSSTIEMMISTGTEDFRRSVMPVIGKGKQLSSISMVCVGDGADMNEHYVDHKKSEVDMTGSDFMPHLSVEDENFLSDLIPSPPFDDLGDMVYDMAAEPFVHQEEVFRNETVTASMTNTRPEKIVRMTVAAAGSTIEGAFVRQPNEKDVISVRGFGKSRPGSLKFRELVRRHHHAYQRTDSLEVKRNLAIKIRDELRPGRFLKKDYVNQEGYRVMDEEETLTKIMFAMRDCKTSAPIRKAKEGEEFETKGPVAKSEKVVKARVRKEVAGKDSSLLLPSSRRVEPKNEVVLRSEYLYEHEIAQLDDMFKYGMNGKASFLPSRALEIYVMIQDLIDRAIKIRHQDSSSINTEWFSAESQLKIRQQLLERFRAAMSQGKSPKEFFEQISTIVFPSSPLSTENVSL